MPSLTRLSKFKFTANSLIINVKVYLLHIALNEDLISFDVAVQIVLRRWLMLVRLLIVPFPFFFFQGANGTGSQNTSRDV